jgi:hypothetical protein
VSTFFVNTVVVVDEYDNADRLTRAATFGKDKPEPADASAAPVPVEKQASPLTCSDNSKDLAATAMRWKSKEIPW